MNVLQLSWGNGLRCREWDKVLVGSNLVCRYGWKEGVGGWVAGVRVLWKDSDTAMRPGAVCVGWHLPYSSNPVFLQLAGYYTSPFLFFFLSFLPSILTHFPTKGINNCLSPLVLSFFPFSHFVCLFTFAFFLFVSSSVCICTPISRVQKAK